MSTRVNFAPVEGAAGLFTPAFCDYLTRLHDGLDARARDLPGRRLPVLERALRQHLLPMPPSASVAGAGAWRGPAPVNAALLGTALTLFYAGRAQADRGQGIYFYLPKLEAAAEARWYRDLFDLSQQQLPFLGRATIRAVVLVESLPCVYEMEEMLYELGPYAAGLNAARWDLKASIFEFVMTDPGQVWPDRFGVDIKTTPFLANIFRRLLPICLTPREAPVLCGSTALPSPDPEVNRAAAEAIRADKEWEARQGFIRGWVATSST